MPKYGVAGTQKPKNYLLLKREIFNLDTISTG